MVNKITPVIVAIPVEANNVVNPRVINHNIPRPLKKPDVGFD